MLFIGTTRSQSRIVKFCSNRSSRVLGAKTSHRRERELKHPKSNSIGERLSGIVTPRAPLCRRGGRLIRSRRICVDGFVKTTMAGSTYFPGYFKWSIGTAQVDRRGDFAIGQVSS